ncbi:unnamed protein product [Umbelopsis ramanniana]
MSKWPGVAVPLLVPGYLVAPIDVPLTARSELLWGESFPSPPSTPRIMANNTKIMDAIKIHSLYFDLAKNLVKTLVFAPRPMSACPFLMLVHGIELARCYYCKYVDPVNADLSWSKVCLG